ncbi:hypothetical protein CRG98_016756 [Punica granatum]|uniref:Uncharacterized protein n=1 Tax=Punica granatum TaxID=22663 RepID=A0A2I0K2S4_PUNGR|nr:hypothetical protein CRG98_016756 [Punica granatum]
MFGRLGASRTGFALFGRSEWSSMPPVPDCSLCLGIVAISVFRECAPKIHRDALATTETSFEDPRRVPKGRLRLVPRPRWSLGACRPVLGCRLLVSGLGFPEPRRKMISGDSFSVTRPQEKVDTPKPRDPKARNTGSDESPHSGPYNFDHPNGAKPTFESPGYPSIYLHGACQY